MLSVSRRDAIKKVAIMVGGSLALPDVLKAWGNLTVENPNFSFLPADEQLIADIAETIIPATATPGAKGVEAHKFIQKIVGDCFEPAQRDTFMKGLADVDAYARKNFGGKGFSACTAAQQVEILQHFEKEHHADKSGKPWWNTMKSLTMTGFFTSEVGCTQVLRYEPVPGRYDGSFPYKKGDKAWAN
jgi:hypothetical protein